MKTIEISGRSTPPEWAIRQRHLFDLMNRAAPKFVERYTRPDGTLIWRDEWPGMDGSDDGYESFLTFPLFTCLGAARKSTPTRGDGDRVIQANVYLVAPS